MCKTHPHTASLPICTNTETPIFIFQAQESACLMARIDRIQALSPLIQGHIIHITTTFPFPKLVVILRNKSPQKSGHWMGGFPRKKTNCLGSLPFIARVRNSAGLVISLRLFKKNTGSYRPCIFVACHNVSLPVYRSWWISMNRGVSYQSEKKKLLWFRYQNI